MGEVRLAERSDIDAIVELYRDYLGEQSKVGGDILPTARSMGYFSWLIHSVVFGDVPGVIVVADDLSGFSMSAELAKLPWDSSFGRVAIGFGTYVSPSLRRSGVSQAMRNLLHKELRSLGFDCVMGGVHVNNEAGLASASSNGFAVTQYTGIVALDEGGLE